MHTRTLAIAAVLAATAAIGCGSGYQVRRVDRSVAIRDDATLWVLPAVYDASVAEAPEAKGAVLAIRLREALEREARRTFRFEVAPRGEVPPNGIGVRVRFHVV